jgi:hypothetical protein
LITVGIDPGNTSGWSIWRGDKLRLSGQGKISELVYLVECNCRWIDVLAIESMYPGRGPAGPKSLYTLGKNTGKIMGHLEYLIKRKDLVWEPTPQEWRAVIGIAIRDRKKVADAAVRYAEDLSGEKMEGPRGGKQIDRAMAVCLGHAAIKRLS